MHHTVHFFPAFSYYTFTVILNIIECRLMSDFMQVKCTQKMSFIQHIETLLYVTEVKCICKNTWGDPWGLQQVYNTSKVIVLAHYYKTNTVQLCKRDAICNYVAYIKIISSDRVTEYLVVIVLW